MNESIPVKLWDSANRLIQPTFQNRFQSSDSSDNPVLDSVDCAEMLCNLVVLKARIWDKVVGVQPAILRFDTMTALVAAVAAEQGFGLEPAFPVASHSSQQEKFLLLGSVIEWEPHFDWQMPWPETFVA